jgi:hypothetical protein
MASKIQIGNRSESAGPKEGGRCDSNRTNLGVVAEGRMLPNLRELWQMGTTFLLTVLAWVFFRAENINHAITYLYGIIFTNSHEEIEYEIKILYLVFNLTLLIIIEWFSRNREYSAHKLFSRNQNYQRYFIYSYFLLVILFNSGSKQSFIYFQF